MMDSRREVIMGSRPPMSEPSRVYQMVWRGKHFDGAPLNWTCISSGCITSFATVPRREERKFETGSTGNLAEHTFVLVEFEPRVT